MDFDFCGPSSTAGIVIEFANNNTAFMEAFGLAYQKLIQTGYEEDDLYTAQSVTTAAPTTPSLGNMKAVASVCLVIMLVAIVFLLVC